MSALLFYITSVASLSMGIYIFMDPEKAFEIQRRFYLKINWEIKPVSWEKEMRNTQLMGGFLILFTVAAIFYYFFV